MLATTLGAYAQDEDLPLWEAGLLTVGASTPAYPASSDRTSRALVLPFFFYRGEVLRADRSGVGARMVHTDDIELDVGFSGALPANSSDVAARKDMPDLGTLVEFGPRLKMTLARPTPNALIRLELPVRAALEVGNSVRQQGVAMEPELVLETRDIAAHWSLSVSGSLLVGDRQLNQYFYGVSPEYATATRPAYEAQAGLISTRFTLSGSRGFSRDVRVFGFVRYDSYANSANRNSPLYAQSGGTSTGIGLMWTLGRSEERAKN